MARREEAVRLYDERFARMWEFYLAGNVVPQEEHDELPAATRQASRRGSDNARLYQLGRSKAPEYRAERAAKAAIGG
jgi:cyclopropane-fatty-acyl-phospholipid synthase